MVDGVDGAVYEGMLNSDMKPHTQGTMTWSNSASYKGTWLAGVQSGHCTMTHENGDIYTG